VEPPAPDVSPSVRNGLKWLAQQQKADGSWADLNSTLPTTITALSGLALLMEGSTLKNGTYAPNLRKAVAWFEKNAVESGRFGGTAPTETYQYMTAHANAMLFLISVHDVDDDAERGKRIEKLIEKGIKFLEESRSSRGAWGYVSARAGNDYDDSQVTATVLQALFAARKAGFAIPKEMLDKPVRYLVKATHPEGGVIYSLYGGAVPALNIGQPHITATAVAAVLMSDGPRPETLSRWVKFANQTTAQQLRQIRGNDAFALLQQYQMARASFALGERGHRQLDPTPRDTELVKWSAYRAKLFKTVMESQAKNGSWPGPSFGPVYSTALALNILQLDNAYLPAFSR
jgi:hypothetical protein